MTDSVIKLYSLLMKKNIWFVRYCHSSVSTKEAWLHILRKISISCVPVYTQLYFERNIQKYIVFLSSPAPTQSVQDYYPEAQPLSVMQRNAISKTGFQNNGLLTPLPLLSEYSVAFTAIHSQELSLSDKWCFPSGDSTESIVVEGFDIMSLLS